MADRFSALQVSIKNVTETQPCHLKAERNDFTLVNATQLSNATSSLLYSNTSTPLYDSEGNCTWLPMPALESQALYQTAVTVWKVCGPMILLLGTVGNVMCLVVLYTLPKATVLASVIVYMSALAVSDTLLLYSGLLRRSLQYIFNIDIRLQHDVICRLDVYLVYLTAMTSAWFLVAMTMQRAMSGVCPQRLSVLGTRRKAQLIVMLIAVVLLVLNAHFFVAVSLHPDPETSSMICEVTSGEKLEYYAVMVFPWIDMTMTSALPSVFLLLTNTRLAFTLFQSSRRLKEHTMHDPGSSNSASNKRRAKAASALTIKLICLSVTFLCLTLPAVTVILIETYHTDVTDVYAQARWELVMAVTQLLWYTNSAINFYLYCLIGKPFRTQLKRIFTCRT